MLTTWHLRLRVFGGLWIYYLCANQQCARYLIQHLLVSVGRVLGHLVPQRAGIRHLFITSQK